VLPPLKEYGSEDIPLLVDTLRSSSRIDTDFRGSVHAGVNGTPTFFINGRHHDGTYQFEDLLEAIQRSTMVAKR
jgi:protein-disulfide isomerase